jgi:hypothetical protein
MIRRHGTHVGLSAGGALFIAAIGNGMDLSQEWINFLLWTNGVIFGTVHGNGGGGNG